ncbi:GPI inositol-deacylase [Gordonia alkaliphila]|uniref:esterase/lipase family protein n=1 Tax=Gordonia alkaliphila TaxID=1053547 RepID=UPI001FF32478|nr:GPI inositol-deacylase [Gordonia alkaliphila]MCK0440513.1 GPI inositol-deacylase [Gordonia alkaliphila]
MIDATEQRRAEVGALTELGLTEAAQAAAGVHRTHRAISDRVFAAVRRGVGPTATRIQRVHDPITDGIYRTIDATVTTAAQLGGRWADLPLSTPPSTTTRGAGIIGVVHGLIGDELDAKQSTLAANNLSVRVAGRAVTPDAAGLAQAFPRATRRIAVYLHGLVETEHAWRLGQRTSAPYELHLTNRGVTNVFIRYNTGRRISTNGHDLAELLDDLVRFWPVDVDDLTLLGHSMGGLVARSAAHHGRQAGHLWPDRVRTSISLGTPHLGAPLEQLAHHASAALTTQPETDALGRLLRRRSAGIRDLRAGSLLDDDWLDRDPDSLAAAVAADVPLLPGADHYFVWATLARNPRNPLSRSLGDGLVLHHSASGRNRTRNLGFDPAHGFHRAGAHHMTLLNDPQVAHQLISWIDRD